MMKILNIIKNRIRNRRLLKQLHSNDFDELVEAIHIILDDSKLLEGPKGNRVAKGATHPWTIDRERAYTIIKILVYLENKDLSFPFYNADGLSVVHAMIKAIDKFCCFERLSYNDFVTFYNRRGLAKAGTPDLAIKLPEDKVTLMGSRFVPYGSEVNDQLVAKFNPDSFDELVSVIHQVLSEVQLNTFPKGFNMGKSEGAIDWNISRERVYIVFPLLQFLKDHTTRFPFARQVDTEEETIIDAMLSAIERFNCFKNYTHDEMLEMYNQRHSKGIALLDIWGESIHHNLGILVKKPDQQGNSTEI
jgi:hypothetical protein